jgi:Hypoxanthine-guanine phosphoribosyltransferase
MEQGNYVFIVDDYFFSPSLISQPAKYDGYLETILVSNGTIKDRINKLASDILLSSDGNDLVLLCVLRGAFRFCKNLVQSLENLLINSTQQVNLEFIRARSYVNDVQLDVTVEGLDYLDLTGKYVVIVEDLVDKGKTLLTVSQIINAKSPASLKIVVLAYKRNPENHFIVPDFIGFSIPDKWIVGYNIDYNGHFRDYPHIAVLNDLGKEKFRS